MADFSTHLVAASALCSISAIVAAKVLDLPATETLTLVAAGTAGGVLPDIDLERSTPTRLLFTALGIVAALAWLFASMSRYGAVELIGLALLVFVAVRWPLAWLFGRFTVHRGALHSLAAMLMCGTLVTVFAAQVCGARPALAWGAGAFASAGYFIHLLLDEIYSVDFSGARIRRSFGSALKPLDLERLPGTVAVLGLTLLGWFWTPPPAEAISAARQIQATLMDRDERGALLLPRRP